MIATLLETRRPSYFCCTLWYVVAAHDSLITRGLIMRGLITRGLIMRGLIMRGLIMRGLITTGLITRGLTSSFDTVGVSRTSCDCPGVLPAGNM